MGVAFGKYHLIAALGHGGMADVYLAAVRGPVGFRKLVVVKRLRSDVAERASFTSMLLDEAQLAARLQHPNVVQTFEVGAQDGEPYIAMEYLDGQSFARILRAGGRPDASFSARVMGDALAGLHYAHELADYDGRPLGIVHRDVSPQNLFVTYAGEVKVVDFGIAKMNVKRADETQTGMLKGKLAYMAPEQIEGKVLDRRTDVFAAGIVLWELLTGRRLFKSQNEAEAVALVLFKPIDPPSAFSLDTPPALEAICMRALERDPAKRWQTAGEMREAIYRYMEGGGGMRRDDAGRYVASLFDRERAEVKAQITEFMASSDDVPTGSDLHTLRTLNVTSTDPARRAPSVPPPPEAMPAALGPTVSVPPGAPPPPLAPAAEPPAKRSSWLGVALVGLLVGLAGTAAVMVAWKRLPSAASADGDAGAPIASAAARASSSSAGAPLPAPALVLEGSGTIGVEAAPAVVVAFQRKRGARSVERRVGKNPEDSLVVATLPSGETEAISIVSEGTNQGFACLAAKTCDIAMAAREVLPAEAVDLADKGIGDVHSPASEHVIALDGIAIIVHPNNPVRAIDRAKVGLVFTGDATDWSAVGGPAGPIELLAHEEGSGTVDILRTLVLGGRAIAPSAKRLPDNARIAEGVAVTPNAIGFVGLAFAKNAKALAISDRGVSPKLPTPFTVTTEAYALARRFYLYTPAKPKPLALELLEFVDSSEGQKAIRDAGFIDLEVTMKAAEPCEHCPKKYASLTKSARRLSLDFRFRPGTETLDARARRDIDRVVRFLSERSSARLLLVGFTEPSGDARADLRRSRDLAQAVDAELAARGLRASSVEGFGGQMPLVSGDSEASRTKNRRVEIWIQPDGG